MVGVSADSMDVARGIGERDSEAFSDRPKNGVRATVGFPKADGQSRVVDHGHPGKVRYYAKAEGGHARRDSGGHLKAP